jgi:hypothetical protein
METHPLLSKRRYCIPYVAFIVLAVIIALPGAARADDLAVDCVGHSTPYGSIQAAVDALSAAAPSGPSGNSIHLLSDCTENVNISGQHRLWLGGRNMGNGDPPVKITALNAGAAVLSISGSQDVTIQNLILTGGSTGLSVGGGSSVTGYIIKAEGNSGNGISVGGSSSLDISDGDAVKNGSRGIMLGDNSVLNLNGNVSWLPDHQPFLISGNGGSGALLGGIYTDGALSIGGGVTIEHNIGVGIFATGGGKLLLWPWHDENVIQHNTIGLVCYESAQCIMAGGQNTIKNNDIGVQITFQAVGVFLGSTTIEGNSTAGVQVISHSHARFDEQSKVRNNGSTTEPLRAGIWVDGTSQVDMQGDSEVTGNIGPGIVADINSSLDVTDATISGNTEEGIRLRHMSIAEIQGATATAGNSGGPLTCDATSLVISRVIGRGARCSNIEVPSGPKPRTASALSMEPHAEAMMEQARRMGELSKGPK